MQNRMLFRFCIPLFCRFPCLGRFEMFWVFIYRFFKFWLPFEAKRVAKKWNSIIWLPKLLKNAKYMDSQNDRVAKYEKKEHFAYPGRGMSGNVCCIPRKRNERQYVLYSQEEEWVAICVAYPGRGSPTTWSNVTERNTYIYNNNRPGRICAVVSGARPFRGGFLSFTIGTWAYEWSPAKKQWLFYWTWPPECTGQGVLSFSSVIR